MEPWRPYSIAKSLAHARHACCNLNVILGGLSESSLESCSLTIAERQVARADVGPLDAELALVDVECIELRQTEPGAVREIGYRTTARDAQNRLAAAGVTLELAERAAEVLRPRLAGAYARGGVVRRAVTELGPAELFEGRVYLATAKSYEGAWLDLAALAFDLGEPGVGIAIQALHLVAVLHDVPENAEVNLATLPFTRNQRPGIRTLKRVNLAVAARLPELFAKLAQRPTVAQREAGPTRVEVLDLLRSRHGHATREAQARLARIEHALSTPSPVVPATVSTPAPAAKAPTQASSPPRHGPLSDPVAWSIESQLSSGDLEGAMGRISDLERRHGATPSVTYLRSRASLLLRQEAPEVIAERVSMLAAKASFDELELLAAQAWMAAGNAGRALPYARVLAQNPRAPLEVRSNARRIVAAAERASAAPKSPSGRAFPDEPVTPHSHHPQHLGPRPASGIEERRDSLPAVLFSSAPPASAPATPRAEDLEIATSRSQGDPRKVPTLAPPPSRAAPDGASGPGASGPIMKGASRPAMRSVSNEIDIPSLPSELSELAEELEEPPASRDTTEAARSLHDARIECTAMARELGRLYRMQLGLVIRTDVASLETIQTQLRERYRDKGVRSQAAAMDVRRHGAFLAEMLARTVAARWTDVGPSELGYWEMTLPAGLHVWPFARVLRLISMGDRERDLVSYYLELYARSR